MSIIYFANYHDWVISECILPENFSKKLGSIYLFSNLYERSRNDCFINFVDATYRSKLHECTVGKAGIGNSDAGLG